MAQLLGGQEIDKDKLCFYGCAMMLRSEKTEEIGRRDGV